MRDVALACTAPQLPRTYRRMFWWWFGLGFPALFAFLGIFFLMVAKVN
ncbi:DUF2269 family protein [Cupriavidus sp. NPDC089707]